MQQSFNSRAFILALHVLNFNIILQTLWPILLAYTNSWPTLIFYLSLLHIIKTDFQNYDIYYLDLVVVALYFNLNYSLNISLLKLFYLLIFVFFTICHWLGLGDLLFVLVTIPFLSDFKVISFLLNATILALFLNKTRHQSYIPFGPCLVLSLMIIHLF